MAPFAYIGRPLTNTEFIQYVRGYNFGPILPSFVVIHNSANPDASWAKLNNNPAIKWDRDESTLSTAEIIDKRTEQLAKIRDYYIRLGWDSGPHLFIDERWIWLFTPMAVVGTHAKSGNSYHDSAGHLHYSIGIETVGWFGQVGWPAPMQILIRTAVQSLQKRLANFAIEYHHAPTNDPAAHDHSISFHSDYNKPSCPGAYITPSYAIPILAAPLVPSYIKYRILAPCAVFTSRDPAAPLAPGPNHGQTWLAPNDIVNVGDLTDGWLWISPNAIDPPGIGFIPNAYADPV